MQDHDHTKPYVLVGELVDELPVARASSDQPNFQNVPKPEGHVAAGPTTTVEFEASAGSMTVRPFDKPCKVDVLWELKACSLMAFLALLQERRIDHEITYKMGTNAPGELVITWDRMAMDENGYHVGSEYYSASCPIMPTTLFGGPVSLPINLDPWCLIPSMFDVNIVSHPMADDFYCPPDEDFAVQEFTVLLSNWDNDIPAAHFDRDTRTWSLGPWEWEVGSDPVAYW